MEFSNVLGMVMETMDGITSKASKEFIKNVSFIQQ
jgi:hypothetical protein